jgi:hypothetical protein
MTGVGWDGNEPEKAGGFDVFRNGVLVAAHRWTDVRIFICASFELTADC